MFGCCCNTYLDGVDGLGTYNDIPVNKTSVKRDGASATLWWKPIFRTFSSPEAGEVCGSMS